MTQNGSASTPRKAWTRQSGECLVSTCDRDATRAGYCSGHYQRVQKHGDPRADIPLRPKQAKWGVGKCQIETCDKPMRKRGWCMSHYDKWRAHGDPLYEQFKHPVGSRRVKKDGYVEIIFGGVVHSEHRLMWEARYGPLLPGQNIHHKNGDRSDNRYENLEIWDTAQPAGQRPQDKVEFAVEMLRRYAPHLLAE